MNETPERSYRQRPVDRLKFQSRGETEMFQVQRLIASSGLG